VYHALVGGTVAGAGVHCGHTSDYSTSPCAGFPVSTDGGHYCATQSLVCTGFWQQYSAMPNCLASFAAFPDSTVAVTTTNDRGSRQYHTQAAASAPPASLIHCSHGGPSGGLTVGTTTGSWQIMAGLNICKANFSYLSTQVSTAIATWATTDLQAVIPPDPAAANYSISFTSGNTDTCRIYHLSVASGSVANALIHCSHGDVLSGFPGVCGNATMTACAIVQAGCGTVAYATQAACVAAFQPYVTAGVGGNMAMLGNPGNMAPTDDSIACRLFFAFTALATKKAGGSVTTACASAVITGSVICGSNMTSMPPSMMKSSATPVVAGASFLLWSLLL